MNSSSTTIASSTSPNVQAACTKCIKQRKSPYPPTLLSFAMQRAHCGASVFVYSTIRGQSVTNTIGNHLQTCPNTGLPNWPDVQDQQIPSSLQVSQNANQGADPGSSNSYSGSDSGSSSSSSSSSGFFSSGATSLDVDWIRIYMGVAGVLVVRIGLMAMFYDPTDLSLCLV